MSKEKWIEVRVYYDTTGLFSEEECDKIENFGCMMFPESVVREWYKRSEVDFQKITSEELGKEVEECTFEDWFNNAYTADDTDGLYWFCVNEGYEPYFNTPEDHNTYKIVLDGWKGNQYEPLVIFKGNYMDCRRFGRQNDWKWSLKDENGDDVTMNMEIDYDPKAKDIK